MILQLKLYRFHNLFLGFIIQLIKGCKQIIHILFCLGYRVGKLLAFCYGDMDFKNETFSITKTYYRRNKVDYITAPKT